MGSSMAAAEDLEGWPEKPVTVYGGFWTHMGEAGAFGQMLWVPDQDAASCKLRRTLKPEKVTPVLVEQDAGHLMCSRTTGVAGSGSAEVEVGRGMGAAEGYKQQWDFRWRIAVANWRGGRDGANITGGQRLEHGRELSDFLILTLA